MVSIDTSAPVCVVVLLFGSSDGIVFDTDQSEDLLLWLDSMACLRLGFHHLAHFGSQYLW